MKTSDLFVKCLEAEGVTHIFGVPDEENAHVMMSLEDSDITFVLCRHEQAAAFIEDAYGRLTGKAGICLGTRGPGALDAAFAQPGPALIAAPVDYTENQRLTKRLGNLVCPI
tara:strand:+ start:9232 stop:9567 length:336 start_codon:yes stop_codon:yes gene_type:complete